jgi:hypothetical protein
MGSTVREGRDKMKRYRTAVLAGITLVLCSGAIASAQTKSIEQLQQEAKAQVRRELNLDTSAAGKTQAPVPLRREKAPDIMDALSRDDNDLIKVAAGAGLVALIVLAILFWKPKKKAKTKKDPEDPTERAERPEAFNPATKAEPVKREQETAIDIYEKIERLQKIREKGAITEAEFTEKKKELLDRI